MLISQSQNSKLKNKLYSKYSKHILSNSITIKNPFKTQNSQQGATVNMPLPSRDFEIVFHALVNDGKRLPFTLRQQTYFRPVYNNTTYRK